MLQEDHKPPETKEHAQITKRKNPKQPGQISRNKAGKTGQKTPQKGQTWCKKNRTHKSKHTDNMKAIRRKKDNTKDFTWFNNLPTSTKRIALNPLLSELITISQSLYNLPSISLAIYSHTH